MATHFARGILNYGHLLPARLTPACHSRARQLPAHRRTRFLASRSLLAELMFMLYGINELPTIITRPDGKPEFMESSHPRFSIAYAGNIVGVALTTGSECGLGMELQRATRSVYPAGSAEIAEFSSNEQLWIRNQNDPREAKAQILTLRQSVLKLNGDIHNHERLQLLPGSGRLRATNMQPVEAICDAEDVLVWSVAVTPVIERLKVWEFDSHTGWRGLPDMQLRASEPSARLMRFTSLPGERTPILS
ncbi:4'-phosphopantetheinyl transferase family protein [Pluralibacter gergoviae]|uniref:Phosphopantetheinyl transferase n=1 Tax=Pluralibacter gergoviae TaxID=61647 RepID=A0A089PJZ3_PLUGE|nr:4'-phosphopantetheinyl transferase [Pluralibacter gergoviae]AIQ99160.1 phosphopantetheinyl transferase [Pluralibacter gergoviae]AVR01961.1 phosphopantetheinyl transferase [Pluralibacter gergoviae]EKV0931749.1 phosphopantetheinyl transferase [Pluralibacter gergoviae]EKV6245123.1 phosphopantetheinyl transferase [Pluralibacter gergoviae]EKW9967679.1 phosphopantetheinyl transferase [Pluralibacter gergoviae]